MIQQSKDVKPMIQLLLMRTLWHGGGRRTPSRAPNFHRRRADERADERAVAMHFG